MRNDSSYNATKEYFEIYEKCKDLQILVLKKDELIAGRALVWKIDDVILMDRVYTAKEHYFEMFFQYAKDNKWWRKREQSYSTKKNFIDADGISHCKTFTIHTDTDFNKYPYIDTFTYGNDGSLTNDEDYQGHEYTNTDGSRTDNDGDDEEDDHDDESWDEISERYIDNDDCIEVTQGRYSNSYTHIDNTVEDVDGEIWWEDDIDIIRIDGDVYPSSHNDIIYDDINQEYILVRDSIEITKGTHTGNTTVDSETTEDNEGEVWADCDRNVLITEIDGEWYDVIDVIDIDGSYYLEDSEEIELINGTYQLKIEEHAA